jgi:hypothetical protein
VKAIVGLIALQLLSCGGEELPPCANNNCTLPGRTIVSWVLNNHPEFLFPNDTCQDLGVVTIRAELVGIDDPTQTAVDEVACGQGQVVFLDLPPGMYTVALTPVDAFGQPLVRAPVAIQTTAGFPGSDSSVTANIPYDSWSGTYTGTFLFRLSWGGVSCEQTPQAITTQTLTLTAGGAVVTSAVTDSGQRLDGTDPKPCRLLSESFAQFAPEDPQNEPGLPFGPATLHVVGTDSMGIPHFDHVLETFVGAAKNNPTITFDVPAPPDAAVDAPPDAPVDAPPDAL